MRNQVQKVGQAFRLPEPHPDTIIVADTTQVVTQKVNNHHVLAPVFGAGEQLRFHFVLLSTLAGDGALDGAGEDPVA